MWGYRALPGLLRSGPGTPIGIGEKNAAIFIATACGTCHGPAAFGGSDHLIQSKKSHQKEPHQGNGNQKGLPAGLKDGILRNWLQNAAALRV